MSIGSAASLVDARESERKKDESPPAGIPRTTGNRLILNNLRRAAVRQQCLPNPCVGGSSPPRATLPNSLIPTPGCLPEVWDYS